MDRPILLAGEGARVPSLLFLQNAGMDGFLLYGHPLPHQPPSPPPFSPGDRLRRSLSSPSDAGQSVSGGTRSPSDRSMRLLAGTLMIPLERNRVPIERTLWSRNRQILLSAGLSPRWSGKVLCESPLPAPLHRGRPPNRWIQIGQSRICCPHAGEGRRSPKMR